MPTVAVDLRALVPEATGIGVYTRELVGRLARRGTLDYLGLAHRPPRGAAELTAAGVAIEHQPAPLGVLWQQLLLPRRLARGDIDLLWSPLQTLPMSCPVPAVVTVHDLTVVLYPEHHRLKVRWSQLPFLGPSLERACAVLADSEATARDLRRHFPAAFAGRRPPPLRVVYPGVSEAFRPAPDDEVAAIRAELGCPDGYLLFAGTLEPRKNVEAVLAAWQALRSEDPATPPLVVAGGTGWHARRLAARIAALEPHGLIAPGRVSDERLVRLFQGARAFLYPSAYEGFGLPVAEAMACGVPVVTSNRSSLPEVAGGAALLVSPDHPAELADAVRKLLADPVLATELGARGRERAKRFSWDRAAQEVEEVLTSI